MKKHPIAILLFQPILDANQLNDGLNAKKPCIFPPNSEGFTRTFQYTWKKAQSIHGGGIFEKTSSA